MALMQVLKTYYNDAQMTDTNSLVNALMERPAELSPIITHLAGREEKKFPLSFLTEGVGNTRSIDRYEYEYRVKTHEINVRPVISAAPAAVVGAGGAPFTLTFPDKWFIFPYTLVSQSGALVRIMNEPVADGAGWKYTLKIVSPDVPNVAAADLVDGALWGMLYANVGIDFSRGNASNWTAPGLVRSKIGTVGRDAVYTNRAFDDANPQGFFPSVVNGSDSALYPYQINERQAFITPQQLDRYAARDGFLSNAWGMQYTKAADDAISTFVTGTLAGPRFPVRNAIEDYLFYLANGKGLIRSGVQVVKGRKLATDIRTATKDLNLGLVNRYTKAKDKQVILTKLNDIDKGIKRDIGKDGKEIAFADFYTTKAEKLEAKRKVLAEVLLRDKFNDAQIGKFGKDFDRYTYEFTMYGDYENLLRSASEGAYNLNAGSDIVSRAKRISRKHGKVVDFTIDGEDYARQFGSFGEFSPLDQEGKLAWAFQIMTKAQDEFASEGMKLLKVHGNNRAAFVKAMAEHIDKPQFASLKPKFDRYVDTNYTSNQQASAIYDDLRTLFSKADNSINTDLLNRVVKVGNNGQLKVDTDDFSIEFLPTKYTDIPKSIVGPKLLPAQQSQNIISDLNTRLWDFLGDANARLSRDQIVIDAAFNIRKELQPYLDDLAKKVGPEVATKQIQGATSRQAWTR